MHASDDCRHFQYKFLDLMGISKVESGTNQRQRSNLILIIRFLGCLAVFQYPRSGEPGPR